MTELISPVAGTTATNAADTPHTDALGDGSNVLGTTVYLVMSFIPAGYSSVVYRVRFARCPLPAELPAESERSLLSAAWCRRQAPEQVAREPAPAVPASLLGSLLNSGLDALLTAATGRSSQ